MNIQDRVAQLAAQGLTKGKIKAYLTIDGFKAKDIASAIRDCCGLTERSQGFRHMYYNFLRTEMRSSEDVKLYIECNGSANVISKSQNFLDIADLARDIHASKGEAKKPTNKIELAYAQYDLLVIDFDINGYSKSLAGRCHTDKVENLGDSALVKLYKELSQKVNNAK